MLKKLTIRNFKAIQNMTINFTRLTALIGGNSCGKTTVLQALDFIRSASMREISEYLREKGWTFDQLRSQFNTNKNDSITFISAFEFTINQESTPVEWTFIINQFDGQFEIKEKVINLKTKAVLYPPKNSDEDLMIAGDKNACYSGSPSAVSSGIGDLAFEASFLKYTQSIKNSPELSALKKYLLDTVCFGILSPENIRGGDKNQFSNDIGLNGSSLAPFIHGLIDEQKSSLDRIVSTLIGFSVKINTIDLGGKIELYIEEEFEDGSTRINKDHISDGLLRIISFAAISLQKKIIPAPPTGRDSAPTKNGFTINAGKLEESAGVIMVDEIENGINPYLTEGIHKLLSDITKKGGRQVVFTTHSPIVLDYIKPDNIIFLWKDHAGIVRCGKMFTKKRMKTLLEALNPGEVWVNLNTDEILDRMGGK
ncbi:MAG: AAA family ATPase [Treponema sp.]|jgi:predicted ATPase|nr:AAA family ATPase [Treponema sp.]